MKFSEIHPGKYYRARIMGRGLETVRVERRAEPRYDGDKAVIRATHGAALRRDAADGSQPDRRPGSPLVTEVAGR